MPVQAAKRPAWSGLLHLFLPFLSSVARLAHAPTHTFFDPLLPLLYRNVGKGGMAPASGASSHHPCQPSMPRPSMIGIEGEHIAW